ncbi:MAG: hypothetical protein AAB290_00680 [Candidatus Eisenbacteria bacterium]
MWPAPGEWLDPREPFLEQRPDWLVVRRGLLTRGAGFAGRWAPLRGPAERDSLSAHYAVARTMAPDAGDQTLLVLRRVR